MPSIVPCETRSPPASPVQSPPRKKFKFSLKLKSKKKGNLKSASTGDNEHENKEQKCRKAECVQNKYKEDKETTTNGPSVQDDTSTSLADETKMVTPPLPFAGLANLGNTCYLNAVLQVLRYCPEFLKSLANLDEISVQNKTLQGQGTIPTDDDSTSDNEDVTFSRPNIIHSVHKLTSEMENAEEDYNNMGMEAEQVKNRSGCTTLAVRPRDFVKEFRFIYQKMEDDESIDEEVSKTTYPRLVGSGDPAQMDPLFIAVEGQILLELSSVTNNQIPMAVVLLVGTFYVLNMEYTPGVSNVYAFLEAIMLSRTQEAKNRISVQKLIKELNITISS